VRRGFGEVAGDLVIIQDADLEYSPEEYPDLIQLIRDGRADVVFGSRFLGRHRVFLYTHYLGNRLLTFLTNVLYNTMLTDMETCYKVMRTEVLRSFALRSNGFGIEPELTAKIFKRGFRVYEVPITYDGRGYDEGKKITWRDGVVALWVLLRYRFSE
jgi:glycosyltransferase involved in cell wall biosynthesis